MKKLYVIRHAKSSWDNFLIPDLERPLAQRGINDAKEMAMRLNKMNVSPDLLMSSHAIRAYETAKLFAPTLNYREAEILQNKELYHADINEILACVNELDNAFDTVLFFCHNPGITYFASYINKADIDNVPTSGILCLAVNQDDWSKVTIKDMSLENFIYPAKSTPWTD